MASNPLPLSQSLPPSGAAIPRVPVSRPSQHQPLVSPGIPQAATHQHQLSHLNQHQGVLSNRQAPPNNVSRPAFPSPENLPIGQNVLPESRQYQDLFDLIQRTSANVVRQVVRDTHEKCMIGSDYHYAFLLNTVFHRASIACLEENFQRFGANVISSAKRCIVSLLTAEDLDEVSDVLLSKLSSQFLDKAVAKHITDMKAESLLNALATAERLGYDKRDVVEVDRDGTEHVIPYLQKSLAQRSSGGPNGTSLQQPAATGMPHTTRKEALTHSNGSAWANVTQLSKRGPDLSAKPRSQSSVQSPATFKAVNAGEAPKHAKVSSSMLVSKMEQAFSKLTPEQRVEFEAEMRRAEENFGENMRRFDHLPKLEREDAVSRLKNCFNTKQSNIRKKYGIRLRERRSKAELEEERQRIERVVSGKESLGPVKEELSGPAAKRLRTDNHDSPVHSPRQGQFLAANHVPPRVAVRDMGGLGSSAATAEHTDPTMSSATSQPHQRGDLQDQSALPGGTQKDPMNLDTIFSSDSDSDTEDEDDDIPAILPSAK